MDLLVKKRLQEKTQKYWCGALERLKLSQKQLASITHQHITAVIHRLNGQTATIRDYVGEYWMDWLEDDKQIKKYGNEIIEKELELFEQYQKDIDAIIIEEQFTANNSKTENKVEINRAYLPELIYPNQYDAEGFTNVFPSKEDIDLLYHLQGSNSIIETIIKCYTDITPFEAQKRYLIFENNMKNSSEMGLTKEFFQSNAVLFTKIPETMADFSAELREQVYVNRFNALLM